MTTWVNWLRWCTIFHPLNNLWDLVTSPSERGSIKSWQLSKRTWKHFHLKMDLKKQFPRSQFTCKKVLAPTRESTMEQVTSWTLSHFCSACSKLALWSKKIWKLRSTASSRGIWIWCAWSKVFTFWSQRAHTVFGVSTTTRFWRSSSAQANWEILHSIYLKTFTLKRRWTIAIIICTSHASNSSRTLRRGVLSTSHLPCLTISLPCPLGTRSPKV